MAEELMVIEVRLEDGPSASLPSGETIWQTYLDGKPGPAFMGKLVNLEEAVRLSPTTGLVLEFGVMRGHSFKRICESISPRVAYGFDWWGGLPHDWNPYDLRGCLKSPKPVVPDNGILIEGLFSDTLEEFLGEHPDPVSFVHIDCDLYCSTAHVLHCLMGRFVTGSVIAFDEIEQWNGEREAWNKYLLKTGEKWELLGKQHAWGEVYVKCS